MSATAIGEILALPSQSGAIEQLLDLAILQATAQSAYVYRFDRESATATLAAFAGRPYGGSGELRGGVVALHGNRTSPVVIHADAGDDWRFTRFPEFQARKFDGVVSVPLLDAGEVVGLANFCRLANAPLSGSALAFLMSLSLPLGALLAASTLREQLRKANQELADRKLFERAKGLLQSRLQVSEEEAYLQIRRLSRRRRTPMREIAREVIQSVASQRPLEAVAL
jgi:GAF domain-containing protein